jgi:hypothetical protein
LCVLGAGDVDLVLLEIENGIQTLGRRYQALLTAMAVIPAIRKFHLPNPVAYFRTEGKHKISTKYFRL